MNEARPGGLYRIEGFDEPKVRVAKLKANCAAVLRNKPPGYKNQVRDWDDDITRIMQQVAANPLYYDDLLTTRITAAIRWCGSRSEVQAMFDLSITSSEFNDAVITNGGALIEMLPAQMKSWAYTLEMPVLEDDHFVVGAVCNQLRASRLCSLLHAEYAHEIRTCQLVVSREFYGYHFPDILTVQEAEQYLKTHVRVSQCG